MYNTSVKLARMIQLWVQVLFYSVLITVVMFVLLPETISLKKISMAFLPITMKQYWYISAYFGLYVCIPILNKGIKMLSEKTMRVFLFCVFFFGCFLQTITNSNSYGLNNGFSTIWLAVMYLLGAYISKYNIYKRFRPMKCIILFVAVSVLTLLSRVLIEHFTLRLSGESKHGEIFISYTSPAIIITGIACFIWCLNVNIPKSFIKWIEFLSPTALSVYLIHTHWLVWDTVLYDVAIPLLRYPCVVMVAMIIASSVVLFLFCAFIDLLRIHLFRLLRVDKLCCLLEIKILKLTDKYLM